MFFNSFDYAIFLFACTSFYYALQIAGHHRIQNRMLLLASYAFYAAWDWRFCFLIALSTVVDYWVALAMHRSADPRQRRSLVGLSLAVNLGLLGYFKYADFFAASLAELVQHVGISLPSLALDVVLPVGISFYTFQTLSYTIDVYRKQIEPTDAFFDFALFVAFFPQLVAGPIERASRLLPQILGPREHSWQRFNSGGWLIFWGIFKKVVIADNLGRLVDMVFASSSTPTSAEMLLAAYAFTFQIYCDFSGYTDVARGTARLLGFELMLNFRLPYFARNPADLWRRWHISLSTWMRDYLYISLGGNRGGRIFTVRNLMITMVLSGLWHGAAMPFVIWGCYHGVLLIAHRLSEPWLARFAPVGRVANAAWISVRVFVMFHLTCLGFLIFRSENASAMMEHLKILTGPFAWGFAGQWLAPLATLLAPLLLMQVAQARSGDLEVVMRWPVAIRSLVYLVLGFLIVVLGEDGGQPFIYFQF